MSSGQVALVPVPLAQKEVLWRLFQLYQHDMSEFSGDLPGADGAYAYRYFDAYWSEPGRYPFFIRAGDATAGFVLVRELDEEELDEVVAEAVKERQLQVHSIAEFFVLRPFRRQRVGEAAAQLAFARFPGPWQVSQLKSNVPAQHFWHRAIGDRPLVESYDEGGVTQFFSV